MRHRSLLLSRLALRRRPLAYWCTTALVAAAAALLVGALTARAEAAAARYGGLRPVVVVHGPVGTGDDLEAGDLRIEQVPRAFVPEGALSSAPEGRTALGPLYPGEVLLSARLAPDGVHGVAALLPEGTRAMAVPAGPAALRVRTGDLVDVLATAPDGTSRVVADEATVVDAGDATTTVAVQVGDAPAVATALTQATVTLALAAPG